MKLQRIQQDTVFAYYILCWFLFCDGCNGHQHFSPGGNFAGGSISMNVAMEGITGMINADYNLFILRTRTATPRRERGISSAGNAARPVA